MARTIRQICLSIICAVLRLFAPAAPRGWGRSNRPTGLDGR